MSDDTFDPESFLTTNGFTIPVTLDDHSTNGAVKQRVLAVSYEFSTEISNAFNDGKTEMVEETAVLTDGSSTTKQVEKKRNLTLNEQLLLVVTGIGGVTKPLDDAFWNKCFFRYKTGILEAILRDVYPNVKTSGG
jgi:hypothetical protein